MYSLSNSFSYISSYCSKTKSSSSGFIISFLTNLSKAVFGSTVNAYAEIWFRFKLIAKFKL